jgi:hypothetical protein
VIVVWYFETVEHSRPRIISREVAEHTTIVVPPCGGGMVYGVWYGTSAGMVPTIPTTPTLYGMVWYGTRAIVRR